jgi:hypothetical protein
VVWAARRFGLEQRIEFRNASIYDFCASRARFDLVVSPATAIGLQDRNELTCRGWPCMAFIEGALADDPTNWWAPNHACVEAMVRSAGFKVTDRPGHEIYLCEPDPTESRGLPSRRPFPM